ncbi:carbohydrate kinase family protein [Agromyces sp. SYSU T00194]|uniref:carbohydrate kinase family protein n=1 Tax=Agromyces chitinivorans TaxID=3158560 RepID=UPI0033950B23
MPSPADPGVLVVAGDLVEDVVVWADEPTRHATDTAARITRTRGGSAANVAAFAAGAGRQSRFIGCVGADAAGDGLARELSAAGVDVRLQRAGATGTVVLIVDADGERTMYPDRGAAALLSAPVEPTWLDGAAWLHLPAYGLEREPARSAVVALADAAHGAGVPVSVDASSTGLVAALGADAFRAHVGRVAPDVVFANADEADLLGIARPDARATGAGPAGAARALAPLVVVKRGPGPAEIHRPGRPVVRVPAESVDDVRDATGAGDAFAAGYVVATLDGADPRAACVAGHALAASVLRSPGASAAPARDAGDPAPRA